MTIDEIRTCINIRVGDALIELEKDNPDMALVRDKLCDAAQFTYFREDGTRADQLNPVPVPKPDFLPNRVLLHTAITALYESDVAVLSHDETEIVRKCPHEDQEVRRLYSIWKSL